MKLQSNSTNPSEESWQQRQSPVRIRLLDLGQNRDCHHPNPVRLSVNTLDGGSTFQCGACLAIWEIDPNNFRM